MKENPKKNGKYECPARRGKKRGTRKVLPLFLVLILCLGLTIGGTLAFLKQETGEVKNTFKAGDIQYTLNLKANAESVNHENSEVTMPNELEPEDTTKLSVAFKPDVVPPTLPGYTFGGWYYEPKCENQHTAAPGESIVVEYGDPHDTDEDANKVEITLYAKWTPITYEVAYNGNGATAGNMENSHHVYDKAKNLTDNAYTRTGYEFIGWSRDSSETESHYDNGESVVNLTTTDNDVVTLYAVWKQMDFTVSFDTQVADVPNPADKTVTYLQPYGELPDVSRTGYTFDGWYTEATGGTQITSTSTVERAENHTLYAHWTPIQYTVVYIANDEGEDVTKATGTTANSTHIFDEPKNLTANGYVRTGYTFIGWNTEPDGDGTAYEDGASVLNLTSVPDDTITLYAQWRSQKYIVHFNANGGTGTMADQEFIYDQKDYLRKNIFTRTGYEFIGWAVNPDSKVADYSDRQYVSNLTDKDEITLYAVWSADAIVVTFESGYADAPATPLQKIVEFDKAYGELAEAPDIEGYLFLGWYTEREGKGIHITEDTIVSIPNNHTLYAHWQTPQIDLLLMFPGSGTKNFDSFAKHDYTFNEAITYTGQTHQGSWESFSIRMSDLVVGGTYQLKFDAAFSDRTCIRGYNTKYDSNDNSNYPIGCTVSDESKYAEGGNTGGSDMYDWKPTNSNKSTDDFVIEFVATKDTMFWLWELSKIRNPNEQYLPDWKPGIENFEESYFDLTIDDIELTLMPADIEFEKTTAPSDNVKAFKRNGSTDTSVNFNLTGGSGKYEKAYTPITNLIVGETYTVNFDLTTNAQGGPGTYHFRALIGPNNCDSNDNKFPSATRVWNGDSFITGSGTRKTSGSFSFKATKQTMYWVWDMTCISNNTNYNFVVNASIEHNPSATPTALNLVEKESVGLPEGVTKGEEVILTALPVMSELEASVAREGQELYGWMMESFFGPEIFPADQMQEILEGVFADAADYGDEVELHLFPLYQPAKPAETEPTDPSEPVTQPTDPSEPATQPTDPSEPVTQPTDPSAPATQPTDPSEPVTQPTDPSEPATQPTDPSEPVTQPTDPSEPATQPTDPSEPATQPTDPSEPAPQSNDPSEPATEPSVAATDPTQTPSLPPDVTDPTEETKKEEE